MNKYYAVAKYSPFDGELELEFVFAKDEMSAINGFLKTEYTQEELHDILDSHIIVKEVKDPKNWRNFSSKNGYTPTREPGV